jgi:hypothetical protein
MTRFDRQWTQGWKGDTRADDVEEVDEVSVTHRGDEVEEVEEVSV